MEVLIGLEEILLLALDQNMLPTFNMVKVGRVVKLLSLVNGFDAQRLHQEWDLPLIRGTKLPKISGVRKAIEAAGDRINLVAGRETIEAFDVAYADFTVLVYDNGRRKAYLIPIIDHASKMFLGWAVGKRAVTDLALKAWQQARDTLSVQGIDLESVTVHHDQDPVSQAMDGLPNYS